MSLVGPRPALPAEVVNFSSELRIREQVMPGITGLWQVEARDNPVVRGLSAARLVLRRELVAHVGPDDSRRNGRAGVGTHVEVAAPQPCRQQSAGSMEPRSESPTTSRARSPSGGHSSHGFHAEIPGNRRWHVHSPTVSSLRGVCEIGHSLFTETELWKPATSWKECR